MPIRITRHMRGPFNTACSFNFYWFQWALQITTKSLILHHYVWRMKICYVYWVCTDPIPICSNLRSLPLDTSKSREGVFFAASRLNCCAFWRSQHWAAPERPNPFCTTWVFWSLSVTDAWIMLKEPLKTAWPNDLCLCAGMNYIAQLSGLNVFPGSFYWIPLSLLIWRVQASETAFRNSLSNQCMETRQRQGERKKKKEGDCLPHLLLFILLTIITSYKTGTFSNTC